MLSYLMCLKSALPLILMTDGSLVTLLHDKENCLTSLYSSVSCDYGSGQIVRRIRVHDKNKMLWRIYNPSLLHHGGQLLRQCKSNRRVCCALINYNHLHHEQAPRISHQQDVDVSRLKTERQVTEKRKWMEEHDGRRQWKRVSSLVGVLGAALLLGGGAVLCEAPEESSPDQNSSGIANEDDRNQVKEMGKDSVNQRRKCNRDPSKNTENTKQRRKKFRMVIKEDNVEIKPHHSHVGATTPRGHEEAVRKARKLLRQRMQEAGAPGLVVEVTVDGRTVWSDGLGYADLENNVRCVPETVMRVASISKSLTMTLVAHLWEAGKLDLDAPIQKYIPDFPRKTFEGEEVTITTRQLISHKSGIRHYALKDPNKEKEKGEVKAKDKEQEEDKDQGGRKDPGKAAEKITMPSVKGKKCKGENKDASEDVSKSSSLKTGKTEEGEKGSEISADTDKDNGTEEKRREIHEVLASLVSKKKENKKKKEEEEENEFDMEEYYIKEEFDTVKEAMELFQKDELFFKPGTGYMYTTHGWTVVSAVVEAVVGKPFTKVATKLFWDLGLDNTYLDKHDPIIYNRASYYVRDKLGKLKNAPYVDNSYKWAGGGFLSTVGDLCKFGNAMLYASQYTGVGGLPGCLKASTVRQMWTPVEGTKKKWHQNGGYGMGWLVCKGGARHGFCRDLKAFAAHSGAAVGASSVLLILPDKRTMEAGVGQGKTDNEKVPSGGTDSTIKISEENGGATETARKEEGRKTNVSESNAVSVNGDEVTQGAKVEQPPKGVVVALITNMQGVGLHRVAMEVAQLFQEIYTPQEGRDTSRPIFSS